MVVKIKSFWVFPQDLSPQNQKEGRYSELYVDFGKGILSDNECGRDKKERIKHSKD